MDLRNGRIFFLGAGFSAGAGVPLTNALLPLAAKLFRQEAPGLYQRVGNYADQVDVNLSGSPDAEDLARLCTHLEFIELREHAGGERFSSDGSREKLALKFFLAKAIALSTPDVTNIPAHYIDFARALTPSDIVVTFNWDLLLERAIDQSGGSYCYSFQPDKVHVVKLHGSINWVNNTPVAFGRHRRDFNYRPLGFMEGMVDNEVYCSDELANKHVWLDTKPLVDQVKPLLVLPGYGKAFDVRLLATLWYRIEFLNLRGGGVSIIGLNVSQDDFVVESLFRYLFRDVFSDGMTVHVLNPDPEAQSRFRSFNAGLNLQCSEQMFTAETLASSLLRK